MPARLLCFVWVLLQPLMANAWSNHASLAWPLLREFGPLQGQQITAEPLAEFVSQEAAAIETTLAAVESWALTALPAYAPTPDSLVFRASEADSVTHFLEAIRVNPTLDYALFRQVMVDDEVEQQAFLVWSDYSFLPVGISHAQVRYLSVPAGSSVSVASVFASASDEPDHGMDIGLYSNNGTAFGKRYGFGEQPFGNPNLPYGSQAPFHMGFYHLDWLTRTAQPNLQATYPLWRIELYRHLAETAFATGHPYWGWRFMGWAMHYIGDLTQPYHALPLPGVSTAEALWAVATGKTGDAVQRVSNRHGVIESYQWARIDQLLTEEAWQAPLLRAAGTSSERRPLSVAAVKEQLTAASVAAAGPLDDTLEATVPPRFISDPAFEWTGSGVEERVVAEVVSYGGAEARDTLDAALETQLRRFADALQRWVNTGLAMTVAPSVQ